MRFSYLPHLPSGCIGVDKSWFVFLFFPLPPVPEIVEIASAINDLWYDFWAYTRVIQKNMVVRTPEGAVDTLALDLKKKIKCVLFCLLWHDDFIWLEKCFFLTLEKYRSRHLLSGGCAKAISPIRKHSDTLRAQSNTYTLPWGPSRFCIWYTRSFVFCFCGIFSKWL